MEEERPVIQPIEAYFATRHLDLITILLPVHDIFKSLSSQRFLRLMKAQIILKLSHISGLAICYTALMNDRKSFLIKTAVFLVGPINQ